MQAKQIAPAEFAQKILPWVVAGGALLIYLVTLNRWVNLTSLPYVGLVAGWDWGLPQSNPLFLLLTLPFRWLPAAWQAAGLNVFTAVCAALTLALLARSVALLPHDRTHEQRQRERSEFSLLSIRFAWVPPLFAALVCGLQLTFWEHSIAATNELLSLLLFAYVIRNLLEYRIDHRPAWLYRAALVYGLGMTNNWAMIGFFPGFLAALVWIRGLSFFQFGFLLRMFLMGLAGLSLYLLVPLIWVFADAGVGFWEMMRAQLGAQKMMLFDVPGLRNRAFLLSLTSILPVLIMGIRWPSSFGDTSAAGTFVTNTMFRVIHVVFLGACVWVAFDQTFSPRALGMGLPFLTFYYLGALAIGYFSGYVLLVFRESRGKSWQRTSGASLLLNRVMRTAVLVGLAAVPAGLVYKNYSVVRGNDGQLLRQFAALTAEGLPSEGAVLLGDDPYQLLLLEGYLRARNASDNYLFIYTKGLPNPFYQKRLEKRSGGRWTIIPAEDDDLEIDPRVLARVITEMAQTHRVFYLHPSFGYYFERLYPRPHGLVAELALFEPNVIFPPPLTEAQANENLGFWTEAEPELQRVEGLRERELADAHYVAAHYSRALNAFGVKLQRSGKVDLAGAPFARALDLDANNLAASINLEFNKNLLAGKTVKIDLAKAMEGTSHFRTWNQVLTSNGPMDEPEFCFTLGERFAQQNLYRQAAIEFNRVRTLRPDHLEARLALANVFLLGQSPDRVLETVSELRSGANHRVLSTAQQLELIQLEAGAHFSKGDLDAAEALLVRARERFPRDEKLLGSLMQMYGFSNRWDDALVLIDRELSLQSDQTNLLLRKADVHLNLRQYDQALACIEQVLQHRPNQADAMLFQGIIYLQMLDHDQALTSFRRIIEIHPDNVDALLSLGAAYLEKKDFEQALEPLDRAIKLEPGNWAAIRNRAIAHLQLGRLNKAREDYNALRGLLPRYHVAYYGLGEIAYRQQETTEAIRNYERYLQFVPQSEAPELIKEKQKVEARLTELRAAAR